MRIRWKYGVVGLAVLAGVGVIVALTRPEREPEYGGKRLSEWVDDVEPALVRRAVAGDSSQRELVADAVGHMGTNAVPHLVKWMRYERPRWKDRVYGAVNPVLCALKPEWQLNDARAQWRGFGAAEVMRDLGPQAAVAIPDLIEIASGLRSDGPRERALFDLHYLGKVGLPGLVRVLTNEEAQAANSPYVCMIGASHVGSLAEFDPATARLTVPALKRLATHRDADVARAASFALRQIEWAARENSAQ